MMVRDRKDHRLAVDVENLERLAEGEAPLPSQLFRHRDIFQAVNSASPIEKKGMINALHYIHFTNGAVLVHATDPQYEEDFLLRAHLDDCPRERSSAVGRRDALLSPMGQRYPM